MAGTPERLKDLAGRLTRAGLYTYWSEPREGDRQHLVVASTPTGGRSLWLVEDDAGRLVLCLFAGFRYGFTGGDDRREAEACIRLLRSSQPLNDELTLDLAASFGLEAIAGTIWISGQSLD